MAEKKVKKRSMPAIQCDYGVKLYEDGKYHWRYDVNLLKNPSVLIDVYKMLGMTVLITGIIIFLIQACAEGINAKDMMFALKITGLMAAIMFVLGILGYLLYAAMSGWAYSVEFTMDENGVEHKQSPRSEKVARRVGFLTVLAGIFAKRPGVVGSGMIAGSNTSMSSDFSNVRKVKALRRMNTIMVNEPFGKNRVYASDDDFEFVYDFISKHCPRAKIL